MLTRVQEVSGSLTGAPGGRAVAQAPDAQGERGPRRVRAVLLREGLARSGRYFTLRAVADVAAAAEGLRCFADHPTPDEDRLRPGRSVRDIVGVFRDAALAYETGPDGTRRARAEATLHVLESATWLWDLITGSLDSAARGSDDLVGLSIDALCAVRPAAAPLPAPDAETRGHGGAGLPHTRPRPDAEPRGREAAEHVLSPRLRVSLSPRRGVVAVVEAVPVLKSCDVVTRAGAGGRFLRIQGVEGVEQTIGDGPEPPAAAAAGRAERAERVRHADGIEHHRHVAGVEYARGAGGVRQDGVERARREEGGVQGAAQQEGRGCVAQRVPMPALPTREAARPPAYLTGGAHQRMSTPELISVREDGERADALSPSAGALPAPGAPGQEGGRADSAIHAMPDAGALDTAEALAAVREAQVRLECAHHLAERLTAAALPEVVKAKLRRTWDPFGAGAGARWPSAETYVRGLESAIDAELEMLGALRDQLGGSGDAAGPRTAALFSGRTDAWAEGRGAPALSGIASPVHGHGAARAEVGLDGAARGRAAVQVALDRLFGVQEADDDPDWQLLRRAGVQAPRWTSLREAYTQITGDAGVTGFLQPHLSIVREANEVTTSVLNFALLNSMTKRLVQDYAGQPQDWRRFCVVRAIRDYKSQDRIRLHDFGSLSTVAEGAAYTNLPWDDSRETYSPAKKGNLVVVTREAILNDDLDAIRKIPTKLAIAAGITMNEFVYNLFTSNPTLSDGSKVFDDGVQTSHGNRGTTALSSTSLQAAITAMMKQTNSAGKRLNLRPRYLLVPPDLLFTALTIVNSTLVPGSNNNDTNVLKGAVEPISVAQFTDATDWYLIADPAQIESIEIGFVGGREAPDLLLQDAPTAGMVFTNDQISFRVRWEFGGGWLDYRGAYWAQVTG